MIKKLKQDVVLGIFKLNNFSNHGLLIFNTYTGVLVHKEDEMLNIPEDLEFRYFDVVSYFNLEEQMITLIFNDRSYNYPDEDKKELSYISKNYLAQVVITKNK